MRVPLTITILLCIGAVAATWWWGTRNKDFMTPPTEARIQASRELARRTIPAPDHPRDAVSAPSPTQRSQTNKASQDAPVIDPTELGHNPRLSEYHNHKEQGSDYLIQLARQLDATGYPQRACLAWERVLDSTKPDPKQARRAAEAIRKLRPSLPTWNPDPDKAIVLSLNAGTTTDTATRIQPALEQLAHKLDSASSGILKVNVQISSGLNNLKQSSTPVALWISGQGEESHSTDLASISVDDQTDIPHEVDRAVYGILRSFLSREVPLTAPYALGPDESPLDAINLRITRLAWQELGNRLNHTP